MRMDVGVARRAFAGARVARLATVDPSSAPHLVPVTFAVIAADPSAAGGPGELIVFAIDHKPKSTVALRRLDNIAAQPKVSFLVDHYADDWSRLWWVRADGEGQVVDAAAVPAELDLLVARYPQLSGTRPSADVLVIGVRRWSGWVYR